MIAHSIEIDRSPQDVFANLDQLERHGGWQAEIVSTKAETGGPAAVGTRVRDSGRSGPCAGHQLGDYRARSAAMDLVPRRRSVQSGRWARSYSSPTETARRRAYRLSSISWATVSAS